MPAIDKEETGARRGLWTDETRASRRTDRIVCYRIYDGQL
jgi:hypothetical protein